MKKNKQKQQKIARKAIRNDIMIGLISKLKEVTANFGADAEKLEKEIQKASNKVAKKLSKKLSVNDSGKPEANSNQQPASAKPKNTAKQKPDAKATKATAVKAKPQVN